MYVLLKFNVLKRLQENSTYLPTYLPARLPTHPSYLPTYLPARPPTLATYLPTSKYNDLDTLRDTFIFNRRLRLAHFFQNSNLTDTDPFHKSTGWTPQVGKSANLDVFINVITTEIRKYKSKERPVSNITDEELKAILNLRNNKSIIIKPADEGGAIVIMNTCDYLKEGNRQLQDQTFYKETNRDLTNQITKDIISFLRFLKDRQLLSEKHLTYLTPKNCRTPIFYMLPKIHKANNPGRPIVSGCDSPTEKLSEYIDYFLQPLARNVSSYIKDTNHFLQKLTELGNIPPDSLLVTIDVTALYTNIVHKDGILAVKDALETRTNKEPKTWILLCLLYLVLTKTCFKFNDRYYEQISGITMGTKCAPSLAIIFMDKFERDFLSKHPLAPLVWWRYIDDIFMIWPYTREELHSFIYGLNNSHPTLRFTHEVNSTTVSFLDVSITNNNQGEIHTSLYSKPTDAHLYLHYTSYHPKHQKRSIPYSQAIRLRRICSTIETFHEACNKLKNNLRNRGYPTQLIEQAIQKAANTNRQDLLQLNSSQPNRSNNIIPFILTFNPGNPPVSKILQNNTKILSDSHDLQHILRRRFVLVQKRCTNLRQILVKTDINPKRIPRGTGPCNGPCVICKFMQKTTKFTSHNKRNIPYQ